jgi:hypothetical protein
MKQVLKLLKRHALSIIVMVVLVGIAVSGLSSNRQAVYNCTLAEFHPDFPIKAREECRRIRREANK